MFAAGRRCRLDGRDGRAFQVQHPDERDPQLGRVYLSFHGAEVAFRPVPLEPELVSRFNQLVYTTYVNGLICPSSPLPKRMDTKATASCVSMDYGIMNGLNSPATTLYPLGLIDGNTNMAPAGVMGVNTAIRFAEITDGLSNTFWVCEDAGRPQLYRATTRRLAPAGQRALRWSIATMSLCCTASRPMARTTPGPCFMNCSNDNEVYSFHPSGAMLLMGDGGVKFASAPCSSACSPP